MTPCDRETPHEGRRTVFTGGRGAGETPVLELIRSHFCRHFDVLDDAAYGMELDIAEARGRARLV